MPNFDDNIRALVLRLATSDKDLYAKVAAIVNDGQSSLTSTYSSAKILDIVAALKNEILGGAGPAYDTLQELRDLLAASDNADDSAIAAINTALANRVRVDAAQTFTGAQQAQARANIGAVAAADVGPTDTDYVAIYQTYLNTP